MPSVNEMNERYLLTIDALFGFSFKPPVRKEFRDILEAMLSSSVPCCSIDIPSGTLSPFCIFAPFLEIRICNSLAGWDVDNGPVDKERSLNPDMLISLTAPKLCAKFFQGKYHYLGGRFVPPAVEEKYSLNLPIYASTNQYIRLL